MSRRFIFTILTLIVIVIIATVAIYAAKGYRLSPQKGTIVGTGILSITSLPDQASIYLDGHLTSATNTNINSLPAKKYNVKITKEGFIPWEKEVEVKEGFVSQIKATLFRAIPSIYPLTYTGAINSVLSPDGQKLLYIVPPQTDQQVFDKNTILPQEAKKSGLWVWTMGEKQISFSRGAEPHQISQNISAVDFTKATFKFSPDSSQLMVTLADRTLLLDTTRFNDPPQDITATAQSVLKNWADDQKAKDLTRLQLIKDLGLRKTASDAAYLKWAPDESKFLYSADGKKDFKVITLVGHDNLPSIQTFSMPQVTNFSWLPDSDHLVLVESAQTSSPTPAPTEKPGASPTPFSSNFPLGKVSIIEYDGFNKSEIYVGNFDSNSAFAWPDGSRLVIISSFPTATASKPNLYGINLK